MQTPVNWKTESAVSLLYIQFTHVPVHADTCEVENRGCSQLALYTIYSRTCPFRHLWSGKRRLQSASFIYNLLTYLSMQTPVKWRTEAAVSLLYIQSTHVPVHADTCEVENGGCSQLALYPIYSRTCPCRHLWSGERRLQSASFI